VVGDHERRVAVDGLGHGRVDDAAHAGRRGGGDGRPLLVEPFADGVGRHEEQRIDPGESGGQRVRRGEVAEPQVGP
jgi:hypothetical protein